MKLVENVAFTRELIVTFDKEATYDDFVAETASDFLGEQTRLSAARQLT